MPNLASIISNYNFTENDFEKAFRFAVDYFLSKSSHTGRTSGEPRGLGAVLDAFIRGKLIEIAVQKMLEKACPRKIIDLDFDMKSMSEVVIEPDIVSVVEKNKKKREPTIYVEIKNTSQGDRWIGLTEEQLSTMKKASGRKNIYIIYSSITTKPLPGNSSSADFVGTYLKQITGNKIFSGFADLNALAKLEFVISVEELEKFGSRFPSGDLLYETSLFRPALTRRKNGSLRKNLDNYRSAGPFSGQVAVPRVDKSLDLMRGVFTAEGDFALYKKTNPKTETHFIECSGDTRIWNEIFGEYMLNAGNAYIFNLQTVGSDPKLKRNNIWIAKRRIYELIEKGKLQKPSDVLKTLAETI